MSAFSNRFFGIYRRPLPDSDVTVDMGKGLCQRLRYSEVMHCPYCQNSDTKVIDTRISDDGFSIRRRRVCQICHKRFTTVESTMLLVRKRSGNVEPFDRKKVVSGVRKACQGRPINEDDLRTLGQRVEEDLRARGLAEVDSDDVGKAILAPLRELDEVAYLRFASVYQNFDGLEDFQRAIDDLRKEKYTEAEQH